MNCCYSAVPGYELACSILPGYKSPIAIVMQHIEVYPAEPLHYSYFGIILICSILDAREEEKMGDRT